ncbi:hypothetical protein ACP70R_008834 [Stipagrostis hirtigluma subsp. patula]
MIQLLRAKDNGWYISRHIMHHNHPFSEGYAEKKQWRSHSYIDPLTIDLIRQLKENNISLSRICNLLEVNQCLTLNPAFRHETVRNVAARLSQESIRDDIGKTVALLQELKASDPNFEVKP